MPELILDMDKFYLGFWQGLMLVLCAGGAGWAIKICFKIWKNVTGG